MSDWLAKVCPTLMIFLPLMAAGAILIVRRSLAVRWIAAGATGAVLLLSLLIAAVFDTSRTGSYAYARDGGTVQMETRVDWIPAFHVQYLVGVDGLSLPVVVMSALVFLLAIIASWKSDKFGSGYFALILLLETGVIGSFLSLDLFLFFVFFELSLLPMYFLIGVWGGERREYAAIKFFLYTLLGSVGILVGMIALYLFSRDASGVGTFDLIALASPVVQARLTAAMGGAAGWIATSIFLAIMFGFLVKVPVVPLHTWLPDAHVEAPTPVSMLLAAVLLKLGGYGILRVAYPIFPEVAQSLWWLFALLGVISIWYGAMCALSSTHFKRVVAYSSVSHMGFVLLGIAAMTRQGVDGAIFVMVAHGLTSAALFFIVGGIYDRSRQYELAQLGGIWKSMPVFSGLSSVIIFASLGLPGLCGFIGEVMVLLGAFAAGRADSVVMLGGAKAWQVYGVATAACFGVVLAAAYLLVAFQRAFFGRPRSEIDLSTDSTRTELGVLIPLVVLSILLGVFPWGTVFVFTQQTVAAIVQQFH